MQDASVENAFAAKLKFFNIGAQDFERFPAILRALEQHAPAALDKLYDGIAATPETATFFRSRDHMRHARDKQVEHWTRMFSGKADAPYRKSAEAIGAECDLI